MTPMGAMRLVLCVAMVVAATSPVASVAAPVATSASCWDARPAETDFVRRLNSERAVQGLGGLRLDPELSRAARLHTSEMATADVLHHTPDHALRSRVTNWIILGENVGAGSSVGSLHDAFMGSPLHRYNILHNEFRHVGIGSKKVDGRRWVTVIFEGVSDPGTSLRMPTCRS